MDGVHVTESSYLLPSHCIYFRMLVGDRHVKDGKCGLATVYLRGNRMAVGKNH